MARYTLLDGTRNDRKLSRSVWRRGKAGDYFKRLPIATVSSTGSEAFLLKKHVEQGIPHIIPSL